MRGRGSHTLHTAIVAPDDLPPLSAAVEVAAYRIAREAIANVARHANATACTRCASARGGGEGGLSHAIDRSVHRPHTPGRVARAGEGREGVMIDLAAERVTPALRALFDPDQPTAPRAFAVLDGDAAGQILTDDAAHPAWGAVREAAYGALYLGGALDAPLVHRLVRQLRRLDDLLICPWPDDPVVQLLPDGTTYDGRALYFAERSRAVDLAPLVQQLPPGCELRRADRDLFARSIDRDLAIRELGSAEAVLAKTLRVFLLRGDEILCEAATGAPTRGTMEIGVTTYEGHRRQGYATIACARLIMLCEEAGYATWWDCAEQNAASATLARKLGYRNGRTYRVLMWPEQRGE